MTDNPKRINIDQAIESALPVRPRLKGDVKIELESPTSSKLWLKKLVRTNSIMFIYWLACSGLLAGYFYLFPVHKNSTNAPVVITAACIVIFCFLLIHLMMRYSKSRISDVLFKAIQ
jgi:membrane protein YdbS with pleckstrin-like domain